MSRTFDTVVFDLDGTLADTMPDVAYGVNHALREMGFPHISFEQVKKAIGPGRDEFIRAIFPGEKNPDTKTFLSIFREIYWDHCLEKTRLFSGMKDVLLDLRNLNLGVASNKPRIFTEKILDGLGIRSYFNEVMGPEDVTYAKPHPEMIIKIMERVEGEPSRTLFVGDTDKDILAGQNAGVGVCGVRYGYGEVEDIELLKPDYLIRIPAELVEVVNNNGYS